MKTIIQNEQIRYMIYSYLIVVDVFDHYLHVTRPKGFPENDLGCGFAA